MTTAPTTHRAPWRSRNGLELPDRVPRADRAAWEARGLCPDADLFTLFREHALAAPGRDAVVDERGALSYGELYAEVLRVAGLFAEAGLGPRDVIALRLPNGRLAAAAELAVYALGAVALPYPLGGGVRDTLSLLARSRAGGAVLSESEDLAATAELPWLRAVFTTGPDAAPGVRRLDRAPEDGPFRPSGPPAESTAPARILVSSGSETEPKMIAYSHQAMAGGRAAYVRALADAPARTGPRTSADSSARAGAPAFTGSPAGPATPPGFPVVPGPSAEPESPVAPPRLLVLVPLASSYGSLGVPVGLAALGGTLIVRGRFDAADALRATVEHRPTHLFGVPTMLRRMADLPRLPGEDTSSLRAVVSSGAALPASTAAACLERFGVPVVTVYGSSDGVNCHTAAPGAPAGDTAGTPDPAVAVLRIVRPDGTPADTGEPGEIQAKGPMTPLCYVAAPDLDARYRTADGWVRTGDLGALDGKGRLRVLGRLRNVVIRGGHTISPAEVEQELGAHPGIAEAVCVPVPDEEFGERLCACVRPVPGAPAPALGDVTAHLAARGLERRKFPEYLLVLDRMPLRPTGKVCRRTAAARAAAALGVDTPPGATVLAERSR
ncbi:class I adenylate-forming enzyme family protein [Streptomyces sp. CS081A]|uniref:class I adenylate-forming enzyme family protein n=1 Tax=Streptomyces sp. CS081A TaxID=2162709 RepID=UPI000D508C0C|nr:class I adenylate-forming enzyme family protein [Streptomyces sp. CS081A]PVC78677.1 AMP-dependent synthetase [Streptomyces sp. CS081A]